MSETLAIINANLGSMSRLVFLRHAHSTANNQGVLSGRLPGVSLSKDGFSQAEALVERLGASSFDEVLVSPMERCSQTISPWLQSRYSKALGKYRIEDNLNEVDYGLWSGRKLSRLSKEPLWKIIQSTPSKVQFPQGEKIKGAQKRAIKSVHEAHANKKSGTFLFVSHGDIIKATVASLIGLPLDSFQNLIINPASLTVLDFDGRSGRLLAFNDTHSCIAPLLSTKKVGKALIGGGSGTSKAKKR